MERRERKVYESVRKFKFKYPLTIAWRLRQHSKIIESFISNDEEVKYSFVGQKTDNPFDIVTTYVIVITNKRILLGTKRLLFGYFFTSITPDLFNDLKVKMGVVWGKLYIDTIKEFFTISKIDKKALTEIETNFSALMMEEKKKYMKRDENLL